MIVCVCHRVSDRDISRAAAAGCTDFETLQVELRVGTACGACLGCARQTFEAHGHRACGAGASSATPCATSAFAAAC